MREFKVQISETLTKSVVVKAKNKEEACKIVKSAYEKCEIVLGADDFCDVEIKAIRTNEPKTEI